MKKYTSPKAELLKLATEDIMNPDSGSLNVGSGAGDGGGELDWGDLFG